METNNIEIFPCKECGIVPIPVKESNRTGIYKIRCMTWDCKNNIRVGGIDYEHAVDKWNEYMMEDK